MSAAGSLSASAPLYDGFDPPLGGSEVAPDTAGTANPACLAWLRRRNSFLARLGYPVAVTYAATASFEFGDDQPGNVLLAADPPLATAGRQGTFSTFLVAADVPVL